MNIQTLERAIRAKCLDCSGGMRNEVRDCRIKDCPLWPHRIGNVDFGEKRAQAVSAAVPTVLAGQMNISDFAGGNRIGD